MQRDIRQTSTTDMTNELTAYSISNASPDSPYNQKENRYSNDKFSKWFGFYKNDKFPELKKAIDAYATWVLGKGWTSTQEVVLNNITGWGEDTLSSILWNMLVIKKINGDSYAEIVRNEKGTLINIKPLSPNRITIIVNGKGIITGYEYDTGTEKKMFQPYEILHLCNDRVADEIHGTSIIECLVWTLETASQALEDFKRIMHRSTIRVLYVDEDDKSRLADLKSSYRDAIQNGEVLILPGKKQDAEIQDLTIPSSEAYLNFIRYLEDKFYKAVGIPKSLTGDNLGIPESGAKMAYLNHEPTYNREVTDLEADFWNQIAIRIKFNRQASLMDSVNDTENKNKAQTGFQPSDVQA